MSKFLREKQGEGEIPEQKDGKNEGNTGYEVDLHGLPQLLTGHDVEKRHGEENNSEQQHDDILHRRSPTGFRSRVQDRLWSEQNLSGRRIL
jgi:hypothetical protein